MTHTLASGKIVKLMDLVFTNGKIKISTKECGKIHLSTEKVVNLLAWVTNTLDNTIKENHMALALTNGRITQFTLVNLEMVRNVDKVNGARETELASVINMKVNTPKTKRMEWEFFIGRVEMFTKVVTKTMRVMVMAKCSGLMAHVTRVNGRMEFSMEWAGWSS